jgi:hypothetical protein
LFIRIHVDGEKFGIVYFTLNPVSSIQSRRSSKPSNPTSKNALISFKPVSAEPPRDSVAISEKQTRYSNAVDPRAGKFPSAARSLRVILTVQGAVTYFQLGALGHRPRGNKHLQEVIAVAEVAVTKEKSTVPATSRSSELFRPTCPFGRWFGLSPFATSAVHSARSHSPVR